MAATQQSSAELSRKLASVEELLAGQRQELAPLQSVLTESQEWVFRLSPSARRLRRNRRCSISASRITLHDYSRLIVKKGQLIAKNADMEHRLDEAARENVALEDGTRRHTHAA